MVSLPQQISFIELSFTEKCIIQWLLKPCLLQPFAHFQQTACEWQAIPCWRNNILPSNEMGRHKSRRESVPVNPDCCVTIARLVPNL
jgi:hypothetical protein